MPLTALGLFLVASAGIGAIAVAMEIGALVRSYRRERHWDLLARGGDPTAKLIVEIRDGTGVERDQGSRTRA
jgi:hypothetical protein